MSAWQDIADVFAKAHRAAKARGQALEGMPLAPSSKVPGAAVLPGEPQASPPPEMQK